jgi:hypothetical protein
MRLLSGLGLICLQRDANLARPSTIARWHAAEVRRRLLAFAEVHRGRGVHHTRPVLAALFEQHQGRDRNPDHNSQHNKADDGSSMAGKVETVDDVARAETNGSGPQEAVGNHEFGGCACSSVDGVTSCANPDDDKDESEDNQTDDLMRRVQARSL